MCEHCQKGSPESEVDINCIANLVWNAHSWRSH